MNKSAEILVALVFFGLIIVGVLAYIFGVPKVLAPTASTTPQQQTQSQQSATTSPTGSTGTSVYSDPNNTFSFTYPSEFTLSGGGVGYTQDWMNNSAQMGLLLVKVVIPQTFQQSTNFVDARFTVGTSADPTAVKNCLVAPESGTPTQKSMLTINGTQYTKFTSGDAGAGNFYDTTSYRVVRSNQCYAIEYTIHYSNIANYPTDSGIHEFDKAAVQSSLEGIVQSFKFAS